MARETHARTHARTHALTHAFTHLLTRPLTLTRTHSALLQAEAQHTRAERMLRTTEALRAEVASRDARERGQVRGLRVRVKG